MFLFAVAVTAATIGGPAGSFQHGQWQGECFRDGTLRGMDDEFCRARWTGNIDVSFKRDADRLELVISSKNSADQRCAASAVFPASALIGRGREKRLINAIASRARGIARRCGGPARTAPISESNLRATLIETDDLTHLPR